MHYTKRQKSSNYVYSVFHCCFLMHINVKHSIYQSIYLYIYLMLHDVRIIFDWSDLSKEQR